MEFNDIKAKDNNYIANTYARFDLDIVKGKGAYCESSDGIEYLDFTSGIGVNSLGFCDRKWCKAVSEQAKTLNHISNLYYTTPSIQLAEKLCDITNCNNVFFANSGAEANECAIKTARKYSQDKYSVDRYEIITLVNSFHGRTITNLAATGQDVFHSKFTPLTTGFNYALANNIDDVISKINDKTCAIMIEIVQGEGGVNSLDKKFLLQLNDLCKSKDLLLIVDEVQTGVGRTGEFLASTHYNIFPDIVTLAKGLGGGLPIGATLFYEKCKDVLQYSDHGSTFGANPIACAGANVVMDRLTNRFLKSVTKKSKYLVKQLKKIDGVKSVSGLGLMIGVEFNDFTAKEILMECINQKVLFLTAKDKLRMLPPLIINQKQIDIALLAIENSIKILKETK